MAIEVRCAYCKGTGEHPNYSKPCPVCVGRGNLILSYDNPVRCNYCSGSGEHPDYSKPCPNCRGAGLVCPVLHE